MLKELYIEFEDGRVQLTICSADSEEELTIYPQRDKIKHSSCKPFKYKVPKHNYLCVAIVKLSNKYVIMPSGVECHPKTTLNDIEEIQSTEQIRVEKEFKQPKKEETKSWRFESSSGGGTYFVKQTKTGKLICDCPGVWRSKDRRCKHIKEVETY